MRATIWAVGRTALCLVLFSLLLKPFTGELNAALLSAAAVIGINLPVFDTLRGRDEFDLNELIDRARSIYIIALVWPISWPTPNIADLMIRTPPGTPAWLSTIGYYFVLLMTALPMAGVMHLLCRVSFSADEIRAANRRNFERIQGLTVMEKITEQLWGGPSSRR
jgi:hypothetical protein